MRKYKNSQVRRTASFCSVDESTVENYQAYTKMITNGDVCGFRFTVTNVDNDYSQILVI